MALGLSLNLPVTAPSPTPARATQPNVPAQFQLPPADNSSPFHSRLMITTSRTRSRILVTKAVEESQESTESEVIREAESTTSQTAESRGELTELGAEIKKAMMERKKEEKEGDLWSGVAEEVQEIEWPAFGKVLGITGVVLGVIAGSSVVLLTVNAVLAELSDRVFAGRGVQDFF